MGVFERVRYLLRLFRRSGFRYYRRAMVGPPYWISAKGRTEKIFGGLAGDASAYLDVIADDCYGIFEYCRQFNPSVIVDIGAHIGIFSRLCAMLFPRADIYAYEPNPAALKFLRENARGTRIKVFPYAVSGVEKRSSLYINETNQTTARLFNVGSGFEIGVDSVECILPSEICPGREIDLLKMDCEGSEWSILEDTSFLKRARDLRMEYHIFSTHSMEELEELVKRAGHRILELWPNPKIKASGILWSTSTN